MKNGNPEPEDAKGARAKREASLWVVKQSSGFSPEEQDAFFEWLAADPEHAAFYASRRSAWKHLDVLADWRPEHSLKPNPDLLDTAESLRNKPSRKTLMGLLGGIAALLAVLILGAWFMDKSEPTRLAMGAFAERHERHVLEDGTVVKLNKGAQAAVRFTDSNRQVVLERGEAHFDIAKDENRPFVVVANGVAVQAVGTMFNVLIDEGFVNVTVTEGKVMVGEKPKHDVVLKKEALGVTVQEVKAGQRSVVAIDKRDSLPLVETVSSHEISKNLTWLKRFDFTAMPLSDVVMEFNRRNDQKMVIDDGSIEDLAISASIQSDNIEVFISVLEMTMNIEAETMDDSTILLRSKSVE